jgi:hypothetical protein
LPESRCLCGVCFGSKYNNDAETPRDDRAKRQATAADQNWLGLAGLKLWQRFAKLALKFKVVNLALKQTGTPTKPRHYHDRNVARYHSISHHFIIWIIFHAKACFTLPPQTKVGSAHIQTNKR